ncbi:Neurotactin [Bagarius yarrelli]|uniref:Neurotactin n=1 Tax=Bagarius yarrelli TaxID=175774 RepID=A0A556V3X5_BAGYA|nr:Neurotactin [Bagarius yarrelli]
MNEDAFEVPERNEYRYLVQDEAEEEVQYVRRYYVSPFLQVSRRCMFLIGCGILALLTLAAYLAYVAQTPAHGFAQVLTDCGWLNGQLENGAYSFKGIPYAVPPVGELRWKPPADLKANGKCWDGVYDATHFRSVCAQVRPLRKDGHVMGHEDCLYLNVWTPSLLSTSSLPVMVWLHGGHLHMLSGQEKGYSPTGELAERTQTVFVSLNYRLNAFGFMALELLRKGSPTNTSGNYGFMDQIQALLWVQKNIHVFGGDPKKITIFGGASVWALMISPQAKGLFHGAIGMSSFFVSNISLDSAERDNLVFLKRTGCQDTTCLRKLNTTQILQAIPWEQYPSWAKDGLTDIPVKGKSYGPVAVLDGYVLSTSLSEAWEKDRFYNDVPLVVGTAEQETDFSPPMTNISTWTWGDYHWFLSENLRPFGEDVLLQALRLYNSSAPCPINDRCPERLYTTLVSDMRASCPSNHLATKVAGAIKSPVYRYLVTYTPSKAADSSTWLPYPSRFSFHMMDSLAFFGGLESALGTVTSKDDAFRQTLTKYFVQFAKEGEHHSLSQMAQMEILKRSKKEPAIYPTGKMPEDWPEFPSQTALLNETLSAARNPFAERCALWEKNHFYSNAWIN